MLVLVLVFASDDVENEQTKINLIWLHVKMCMSDCRKTVWKYPFFIVQYEMDYWIATDCILGLTKQKSKRMMWKNNKSSRKSERESATESNIHLLASIDMNAKKKRWTERNRTNDVHT